MICAEHDSVGGSESGNRWPVVVAILVVAGMQWRQRIQVGPDFETITYRGLLVSTPLP